MLLTIIIFICHLVITWLLIGLLVWVSMCLYAALRWKKLLNIEDILAIIPCTIFGFITLFYLLNDIIGDMEE